MRRVISVRFKKTLLFMVEYWIELLHGQFKQEEIHTQTHQALRVYGSGGIGRRITPDIS